MLANRNVFLRQRTANCKHNSARFDNWLEILAVQREATSMNFSESNEEEDERVHRSAVKLESE